VRLFNQTCRLFRLFIPLPRLQVRVGVFSPHARSQTPAWCLFRMREGLSVLLLLSTFVLWDVCSTRHLNFHFGAASLAGCWLFSSCRGQTSACGFFESRKSRLNVPLLHVRPRVLRFCVRVGFSCLCGFAGLNMGFVILENGLQQRCAVK
jgi:hypothetical protein